MAIQIDRAIFLHIPKTGGTWVTRYFRETNMSHNVEDLELAAHINGKVIRELRPNTEDLCFCFVRHPLTWYRSYWQMRNTLTPNDRHVPFIDSIVDLPFHQFIEAILDQHPNWLTQFFDDYIERCRLIGKQENLRNDLDNILKLLNIPYDRDYLFSRPLQNVSNSNETYTYKLAKAIMEGEHRIIKEFNYNYIPLEVLNV